VDETWFRERLLEERRRLRSLITAMEARGDLRRPLGEAIGETALYDNHPGDVGSETFEREKELGLRDSYRTTLELIELALDRLAHGSYGRCERCGKTVPEARLRALPWTPFCLDCEESVEQERVARRAGRRRRRSVRLVSRPWGVLRDRRAGGRLSGRPLDAWQAVARYGTSSGPARLPRGAFDEAAAGQEEDEGVVDPMDAVPESTHDPGREVGRGYRRRERPESRSWARRREP